MPAPGIYHVIGTEVNGGRRIESAPFKDGYYDDPGYEIEYWLEPIDITEDRPVLKNFFGEDVSLDDVHETYIKAKPLFQYAQALEEYIDSLLAKSEEETTDISEGEIMELVWLFRNAPYGDRMYELEAKIKAALSKLKPREVSVGERSVENDLCECGHERKYHGKSKSINYTEGKCNQCDCENFVIDSRSNLTKAEAIIRNYLRIRPRDHIKFLMAMKAVDELYYSSYNKDQT